MYGVSNLCELGPIERYLLSHVVIVLDLSLGTPGFDFSQVDVLKAEENRLAVRSDVAQMPWGVTVRSHVIVDSLDAELDS